MRCRLVYGVRYICDRFFFLIPSTRREGIYSKTCCVSSALSRRVYALHMPANDALDDALVMLGKYILKNMDVWKYAYIYRLIFAVKKAYPIINLHYFWSKGGGRMASSWWNSRNSSFFRKIWRFLLENSKFLQLNFNILSVFDKILNYFTKFL